MLRLPEPQRGGAIGGLDGATKKAGGTTDKPMTALRNERKPGRETGAGPACGRNPPDFARFRAGRGVWPQVPDRQLDDAVAWASSGIMSGNSGRKLVAKSQFALEHIGEGEEAWLAHWRTDELHYDRKARAGASAWN